MASGFVGLHIHSEYSTLDGRARCAEIAAAAAEHGDEAVALTDHDEVAGHLDFQRSCLAAGVKPVFGTEARWLHSVEESRHAKTGGRDDSHIVLLAADRTGLQNLWTLSSLAYEPRYFYRRPQLELDLMRRYAQGLWASDGCGFTRFANHAEAGDIDAARREWAVLLDVYGDRFYSELHTFRIIDPQTEKDRDLNARITAMNQVKVRLAAEMGVPLVAVNDAHYAQEDQWEQHRLIWQMSVQSYKDDQVEAKGHAADWMMTRDEIVYHLSGHGVPRSVAEEAIANTAWIAGQCDVEITPTLTMPRLHATDADDAAAFHRAVEEGFDRFVVGRGLDEDAYRSRLEYESRLIVDQGMPGYFNIVADYVRAARDGSYAQWVTPGSAKTPCLCGPGRGSGGGSLVNYLMGITSIDPIKYDLMFERFINPDRPDPPDIDVDFQQSRRADVKTYLARRYGEDNVCSIGTYSRSGPKQTIKDVARALRIDYRDTMKIVDLVGEIDHIDPAEDTEDGLPALTWADVLSEQGGDLAGWVRKHPELFQRVEEMTGLMRQTGVHAAGVLINTEPLLGAVPTRIKKGVRATQFDMTDCVGGLGGVKDDLLGNKGLDVLAAARDLIYRNHRVWLDYDGFGFGVPAGCPPENIVVFGDDQYEDSAIWEQIDRGQTAGVFQVGTPGGTKQAMRFRPRSLPELADLVSINRPGVIRAGLLDTYLRRRRGEEEVVFDHPLMRPITERTMGILVYQEDLIRTAREVAGFTAGQAEVLRKAIGKKQTDKISELEPKFISGCMKNTDFVGQGGTQKIALKIWNSLSASGQYAFNKAHATGYAMQPCWEIWTKHYFFDEFITACLSTYADKTEAFIRECRRRGRPVRPPCVNRSGAGFTLTDDGIRYGLADVRGVGGAAVPEILARRPFTGLEDYLHRTTRSGGGKRGVADALIKAGAFDGLHPDLTRMQMLDILHYHWASLKTAPGKWAGLTADERDAIVGERIAANPEQYAVPDLADEAVLVAVETELLGTFVSVDPMARYAKMIEAECIQHPLDMDDRDTGSVFAVGGRVTRIRPHSQRNGKQMAFLTISWAGENFDIVAFADAWAANRPLLKEGVPVACQVIKLDKGGQLSQALRLDWILEGRER